MTPPDHHPTERPRFGSAASHDPLTILGQRYWPTYLRVVAEDGTVDFRPLGRPPGE